MRGRRGANRVLMGKPEGRRPLGRAGRRWKNNIKWISKKWNVGMNWIDLAHDRDKWRSVVNAVMNL